MVPKQQYSQSESSGEKRKLQAIAGSYDPASSTKVTKKAKLGLYLIFGLATVFCLYPESVLLGADGMDLDCGEVFTLTIVSKLGWWLRNSSWVTLS